MSKDIPGCDTPTPNQSSTGEGKAAPPRRVSSAELFGMAREVIIVHSGSEYRLRVTGNDKLILTKKSHPSGADSQPLY